MIRSNSQSSEYFSIPMFLRSLSSLLQSTRQYVKKLTSEVKR